MNAVLGAFVRSTRLLLDQRGAFASVLGGSYSDPCAMLKTTATTARAASPGFPGPDSAVHGAGGIGATAEDFLTDTFVATMPCCGDYRAAPGAPTTTARLSAGRPRTKAGDPAVDGAGKGVAFAVLGGLVTCFAAVGSDSDD